MNVAILLTPTSSIDDTAEPRREEDEMFQKVLAATDLITVCDAPVLTAAKLAKQTDAKLYIIHVLESASFENRHLIKDFKTGKEIVVKEAYIEAVKKKINRIYEKASALYGNFEIKVTIGFPWIEIIRWAREEKADLIVLGPHSLRAKEKGVIRVTGKIGSTIEGVLTRENCPVMIVNQSIPNEKLKFKNVMVSIDFSKSCECALNFAVKITQKFSSKLFTFHMIPVPPYPKYSSCDYEADVRNLKQRLKDFGPKIPDEIDHQLHIWGGALPHLEIIKCVQKNNIDLILMGSHTKEKTGKWYPGSVVEQVSCRSSCPVVVVTDPEVLLPWEDDVRVRTRPGKDIDRLIRVFSGKGIA